MRKHFLILMLLALLPLAGWASTDLTGLVNVSVGNVEYGQTDAPSVSVTFKSSGAEVSNSYFDIEGFYTTSDATGDKIQLNQLPVGATRYAKIVFKDAYSGSAIGSFSVSKCKITVDVANAEYFKMTYKTNPPRALVASQVAGKIRNTDIDEATYLNIDPKKLNQYTFTGEAVSKNGYDITFPVDAVTPKNSTNYEVVFASRKMVINPAVIAAAAPFSIKTTHSYNVKVGTGNANDAYMYSASPLRDTYTIKMDDVTTKVTKDSITLVPGTDFEVKYYEQGTTTVVANPTNAGTYDVKIFGKGNYTTATNNAGVNMTSFTIQQRPVTIKAISQDKEYDGLPVSSLFANADWNVNGLQGADQSLGVTGLRVALIDEDSKNVKKYQTTVAWDAIKVYNFTSFDGYAESADTLANGTVQVLNESAAAAEVKVLTNTINGFAGNQYKIYKDENESHYNATTKRYQLYNGSNYETATGMWVTVEENTTAAAGAHPAAKVGNVLLTKNYTVTPRTSTWEITKKDMTLEIGNLTLKKGQALDATLPFAVASDTVKIVSGALDAEKDAIKTAFNFAWATAAAENYTDYQEYNLINGTSLSQEEYNALPAAEKIKTPAEPMHGVTGGAAGNIQIKVYEGAVKATKKDGNEIATLLGNYNITFTNGNLTVRGKSFNIDPIVKSVMEYGDTYAITFDAYDPDNNNVEIPLSKTPSYTIKNTATDAVVAGLPTARGTYEITITADETLGTGDYQYGDINYGTASFVINKKHLDLTVADQTVLKNDLATKITDLTSAKADKTYTLGQDQSLVGDEEIALTFSIDETVVKIENGRITGYKQGKNSANPAIKVVLGDDAVSANYDITNYIAGKLIISEAFFAKLQKADALETIAEATTNGSKYDVIIADRKLNGGVWNALVLPFDVDAFAFCQAIGGYAVFNTLKSATNGNVKFGLYTGTLKANEPFLVKPNEDVNFADSIDTNKDKKVDTPKYKFTSVVFKNATPTFTKDGVSFVGNYDANPTLTGGEGIMALNKQEDNSYKFVNVPASVQGDEFIFMGAYLNLNGTATTARVFVEEADGTVTAISTIAADGVAVPAEGWYTLNGVKLQAAPTAKGVYINNGKKVVIK